jgi:hypothetical protein
MGDLVRVVESAMPRTVDGCGLLAQQSRLVRAESAEQSCSLAPFAV